MFAVFDVSRTRIEHEVQSVTAEMSRLYHTEDSLKWATLALEDLFPKEFYERIRREKSQFLLRDFTGRQLAICGWEVKTSPKQENISIRPLR